MNGRIQLTCQRAGCDSQIVSGDPGRAHVAAGVAGWRHDGWGWWCDAHATVDTLPSPSIADEEAYCSEYHAPSSLHGASLDDDDPLPPALDFDTR